MVKCSVTMSYEIRTAICWDIPPPPIFNLSTVQLFHIPFMKNEVNQRFMERRAFFVLKLYLKECYSVKFLLYSITYIIIYIIVTLLYNYFLSNTASQIPKVCCQN